MAIISYVMSREAAAVKSLFLQCESKFLYIVFSEEKAENSNIVKPYNGIILLKHKNNIQVNNISLRISMRLRILYQPNRHGAAWYFKPSSKPPSHEAYALLLNNYTAPNFSIAPMKASSLFLWRNETHPCIINE